MKNKSTVTAGLILQSLIAHALNDDYYFALAGIDLSSAFENIDVELLIKHLLILGLSNDVVDFIKIQKANPSYSKCTPKCCLMTMIYQIGSSTISILLCSAISYF